LDLRMQGRGALVTGASAGIGKAVARALAGEGAQVGMVARRADVLQRAAVEIEQAVGTRPWTWAADISQPAECADVVDRAAQSLGGLDILVNSVPAPVFGSFLTHGDDAWEEAMRLKFHTYVRTIRAAVPYLSRTGRGVIINVIGVGGKAPVMDHLAGGAANAALMLLTAGLAKEFGSLRIRVVGVSPGATRTERFVQLTQHLAEAGQAGSGSFEEQLLDATPTGSLPQPEDIADTVTFLASIRARQINGTTITIDGGAMQTV
jgi:NAD(P)-dependent dehydrogenase (short-subunit alcohol dehydrogenase family)